MSDQRYANGAQTTLNGAITSGATSLTVASATGFPATAPFRIVVTDNTNFEVMEVTAGAGSTTWTVTRGVESYGGASTAFAFAGGSTVAQVLTAATLGLAAPALNMNVGGAGLGGGLVLATRRRLNHVGFHVTADDDSTNDAHRVHIGDPENWYSWIEDFDNLPLTTFQTSNSGTSTGVFQTASQSNHPGLISVRSGAAAAAYSQIYKNPIASLGNAGVLNIVDKWRYQICFQTPATLGQSDAYLGIGMQPSGNNFPPYTGVIFCFLAADGATPLLKVGARSAGVWQTSGPISTGVTLAASTWYTVSARYDLTSIYWSVKTGTGAWSAEAVLATTGLTWPPSTYTNQYPMVAHTYQNTGFVDLPLDYIAYAVGISR
jgi:hypothetical protein